MDLTAAVADALTTMDALHRVDPWANQCLTCGPEGGRWPCETHMVADDLRAALDGEGQP